MTQSTTDNQAATVVGRIPSGVSILTAATADRATGMLASWVQQASFEPLMISVCVKKGRPVESIIDASGRFTLNLIGGDPKDTFKHFGKGFAPDDDAFQGLDIRNTDHGVVLANAMAFLQCDVQGKHAAGDHHVYLGRVVNGAMQSNDAPYVHRRKSAQSY